MHISIYKQIVPHSAPVSIRKMLSLRRVHVYIHISIYTYIVPHSAPFGQRPSAEQRNPPRYYMGKDR